VALRVAPGGVAEAGRDAVPANESCGRIAPSSVFVGTPKRSAIGLISSCSASLAANSASAASWRCLSVASAASARLRSMASAPLDSAALASAASARWVCEVRSPLIDATALAASASIS